MRESGYVTPRPRNAVMDSSTPPQSIPSDKSSSLTAQVQERFSTLTATQEFLLLEGVRFATFWNLTESFPRKSFSKQE
jgi:hypothetical protein